MMIGQAPHITLALAIEAAGNAVDYLGRAGIAGNVTIRHARNRKPVRAEKPCMSIIIVSDDYQPDEADRNDWEQVRELIVDLQADLDLDTEDSGDDPTGLDKLSRFVAAFVAGLKDPEMPTYLGGLCDWIRVGALEPDDRSTPDDGRMTRAIHVLYRVRSDDANVLLAQGVNG
jgi:hypothetical protein